MKGVKSSVIDEADDQNWRTFVRQFTVFCLNIAFNIPKGRRTFLFISIPIKTNLNDVPINTCLRESSYEKLRNLTSSELEGVVPLELVSCIDAMLASKTPRDFEEWIEANYNDYHTPRKVL